MAAIEETWLEALKRWVDATSARKVAKTLAVSPATISLCLRGLYPANTDNIQIRVEALLVGKEIPGILYQKDPVPTRPVPKEVKAEVLQNFCPGSREGTVQRQLAKRERGQTEVPCMAGSVDFLTTTEVVEIKEWRGWKEAIKVLIYVGYFPGRTPRIHLFNNKHLSYATREMIQYHYDKLGIRLTWHEPFLKP